MALQVVIDKMNDLFGAESFTASQVREFVQGLVQRLLAYPDLVNQTKVNSKKQFMESQDFQAAVTEAVLDNQEAHNTMSDCFFSDGPGISAVIMARADAFYEAAIDQPAESLSSACLLRLERTEQHLKLGARADSKIVAVSAYGHEKYPPSESALELA